MHTFPQPNHAFDEDEQAKIREKINGTELEWWLGFTRLMIDADLVFRV